jgi:hypothetical protein
MLVHLYLYYCLCKCIAEHCQYLEKLSIVGCAQTSNTGVSAVLRHCNLLSDLSIRGCTLITHDAFTLISSGQTLTSLNLAGCHRISGDGLLSIVKQCNQLTSLNAHAIKLTDAHMEVISRTLAPSLTMCDISNANPFGISSPLTDHSLTALARCQQLHTINLQGSGRLTDGGLQLLLGACRDLQRLDISGCIQLTDGGIARLARCKRLQYITISMCESITDDTVHLLLISLPLLTYMDINDCALLTNAAIAPLIIYNKYLNIASALSHIDMTSCRAITNSMIEQLQSYRPSLTITH